MRYLKLFEVATSSKWEKIKMFKNFCLEFGALISLGLSMVQQEAIDAQAKNELASMQKRFREPIINGKTYFQIMKEMDEPENEFISNPKLTSALLLQIKNLLEYIEPRIIKFTKEGAQKSRWIDKIQNLKETYKKIITF